MSAPKFTYQNPIDHGCAGGIRDAQILREDGRWYLTGTVPGFYKGEENPGVRLYSSDDLLLWRDAGLLIDRRTLPVSAWYRDRFWATELHQWQGRWCLGFTSGNESKEYPFYGAISPEYAAKQAGVPPEYDPASPFMGAGHNAVFTGPDGRLWLSCHGMLKSETPHVCIDPIPFDEQGNITHFGPSYQPQITQMKGRS